MFRFLRTTVLGGIVFLIPIVIFISVTGKAWELTHKLATPLARLLPVDSVARHLGKKNVQSVLKASLLGIPLPLCSCGVIPAAISLRKQGASKGASAAFLVSVPETGVDSIAITWALLDPLMTIVRPVASFLTATVTGLLINLLPQEITTLRSGSTSIPVAAWWTRATVSRSSGKPRTIDSPRSISELNRICTMRLPRMRR